MLLDRLAGYARPRRRPEVLVWTIAVVLCLPIQHGSTADVPQKATHAVGHGSEQPHQPQASEFDRSVAGKRRKVAIFSLWHCRIREAF
jgi:hypothetical protein